MIATINKLGYSILPQNVKDMKEKENRELHLSLARTKYNYMKTYLESVHLSSDVPKLEKFSLDYQMKVLQTSIPIVANFSSVVFDLLGKKVSFDAKKSLEDFIKDPNNLSKNFEKTIRNIINIPENLVTKTSSLQKLYENSRKYGITSFLRSTLYYILYEENGIDYIQAQNIEDYDNLFKILPKPLTLAVEEKPWMKKEKKIWDQDWFFGYLQIAGFNTTLLRGVRNNLSEAKAGVLLSDLINKIPVTDSIFQNVIGDSRMTLKDAAEKHLLYVCDYTMLEGKKGIEFHGKQRYVTAPIALFYWNTNPPEGYPPGGAMQPIAIQLGQKFDREATPIFTPNNCSDSNDENGLKWKIAKYIANTSCSMQHESVAHFGGCHLMIETMVVATHRQLSDKHPLFKLLIPHFRFTLHINYSALHSLIVPGGVVATNVGPAIEDTLQMISDVHESKQFDKQNPDYLFTNRGVASDSLPLFPFRDDTLLLWKAIKTFVSGYLKVYYENDTAVQQDTELQGWINELVSPVYAGFKKMDKLKITADSKQPYQIDTLEYLIDIVSEIIYIAGPQHASVNYAQYPLLSYAPSVAGTIYNLPPNRNTEINSEKDCIQWYPPLDVALYTSSFVYLLSGIQYDTFGHYDTNPQTPYFQDPNVQKLVKEFQNELANIESDIQERNKKRPMPYLFQLPSKIPNSISI